MLYRKRPPFKASVTRQPKVAGKRNEEVSELDMVKLSLREILPRRRNHSTERPIAIRSVKDAKRVIQRERRLNTEMVTDEQPRKEDAGDGLLGQYARYEQMSKKQLIEKLISLQMLAAAIFKKNKALEQQLKA